MSAQTLKWIAIIAMTIDHIGAILLPQAPALRAVGRLAFPIFAFLTAESVVHTHSRRQYLLRLLLFGAAAEFPFRLAFGMHGWGLRNVLFTLLLGALACMIYEAAAVRSEMYLLLPVPLIAALLLRTDYGAFGAAAVLLFFALRQRPFAWRALCFAGLTALFCLTVRSPWQLWSLTALLPLACYNGQRGGHGIKYFFHVYYPAHLLVLAGLAMALPIGR